MRKLAATLLICPLLAVALGGCSADVPPPEPPPAPPAVVDTAPLTGRAARAAQKKQERKRALKLQTIAKHDLNVAPSSD